MNDPVTPLPIEPASSTEAIDPDAFCPLAGNADFDAAASLLRRLVDEPLPKAAPDRAALLKAVDDAIVAVTERARMLSKLLRAARGRIVDGLPEEPAPSAPAWSLAHDYRADWNAFAESYGAPKINGLTPGRRAKLRVREPEGFSDAWPTILAELEQATEWWHGFNFSFDWLIKDSENWQKVHEGKYRDRGAQPQREPTIGELISGRVRR